MDDALRRADTAGVPTYLRHLVGEDPQVPYAYAGNVDTSSQLRR